MEDCVASRKQHRISGISALPRVISTEYLCSYAQKYGDRSNAASPREASADCYSEISDLNDSSPKGGAAGEGASSAISISLAPVNMPFKPPHAPALAPFQHPLKKRGREESMDSAAVSSLDDLLCTPPGRLPLLAVVCPDAPSKPRRACPPSSARLRKLMRPLDFSTA